MINSKFWARQPANTLYFSKCQSIDLRERTKTTSQISIYLCAFVLHEKEKKQVEELKFCFCREGSEICN